MIIGYNEAYLEEVRDLPVELEEHLASLDKDHLDRIHEDYRKKAPLLHKNRY